MLRANCKVLSYRQASTKGRASGHSVPVATATLPSHDTRESSGKCERQSVIVPPASAGGSTPFGTDLDAAHLGMRLDAFFQQLGINPLSDAQQRVVNAVNTRKAALVEHAVGDLQSWQTQLRALANHLEDLEARSRRLE